MATSNTQRTLSLLKSSGYRTAIVERFLSGKNGFGVRKDMFGFGDIIAINETDIIAVQSCGTAFSEHHNKLLSDDISDNLRVWLSAGGMFVLIGWRKVKEKRGGKRMIYKPRIREYMLHYDNKIHWKDKDKI